MATKKKSGTKHTNENPDTGRKNIGQAPTPVLDGPSRVAPFLVEKYNCYFDLGSAEARHVFRLLLQLLSRINDPVVEEIKKALDVAEKDLDRP